MVPRNDVVFLDADKSLEENLSQVEAHRYSRFPVVRGNWEEVLGIVSTSQLLNQMLRGASPSNGTPQPCGVCT